jgi:TP901 family phage tail tape measure protein
MEPAAVLGVIVKAQGVRATNAQLASVQTQLQKTNAAAAAAGLTMQKAGAKMSAAGAMLTKRVTVPLVALGAAAIKTSLDFNRSMTEIQTQAGASRKEMERMKRSVEALGSSGRFAQGPQELAEALFDIESVGFRGAKALKVLKASSDLATVGNSDLEKTTSGLVGILKTGIKGSQNFKHAIGTMNATIGAGKLHMEDLNAAIGTGFAGTAKALGVSLTGLGAALAELTSQGVPASSAATRLRMSMSLIANPTDKAKKALGEIGIGSEELAKKIFKSGSLIPALATLKGKFKELGLTTVEQNQLLTSAFGGAKSGGTILQLIGNLDDLRGKQEQVANGQHRINEAIKETNAEPVVQLQKAWSALRFDLIKFGEILTPIIVPALLSVLGAISHVSDAFHGLGEGTQKAIIYVGLFAAAVGPVLSLFGWLTLKAGELVVWLDSVGASFSAQATEASVLAGANMELAASMEGVALAQKELLVANASGAVVGAVPVAAEGAVGAEAGAAGGLVASKFAGGLATMLPAALAAAGVVNILSSVLGGDTHGAAFKTGGAVAGGIAGGIAFGLPGALAGAGIGSILGGFVGKLFGDDKHLTATQEAVRKSAGRVAAALHRQKAAADALHTTDQTMNRIGEHQKKVKHEIAHAEAELTHARQQYKSGSPQVSHAEMVLSIWRRRNVKLTHEQNKVEHLHGIAAWGFKKAAEAVIIKMRERIGLLKDERTSAALKLTRDKAQHASLDQVEKDYRRWNRVTKESREEQGHLGTKVQEVAQTIGPKFAHHLRNVSLTVLRARNSTVDLKNSMHNLIPGVSSVGSIFDDFGKKAHRNTEKAKDGVNHVKNVMGPFQTETHKAMKHAKADMESFGTAGVEAIEKPHKALAGFAKELGIGGVTFGVKQGGGGGKEPKKASGGVVVPGAGSGDKVPLRAMVEPGEVIHVLNKRASRDLHKLSALETLNKQVPRLAGGGALGTMHAYKGLSGDTDFWPEMGFALSKMATGTGTHINVASGYRSIAEQAALYALYQSGQGNLAAAPSPNAPHVRGYAADISPDRGTFGGVAGNYGLGFTVPSEAWHIELINKAMGAKGSFAAVAPKMPHFEFTGPKGALQTVGQGITDSATKVAQKFLNQHVGAGGIGNVPTGPVVQMAKAMISNVWGMGQWSPFNSLEMQEAGWDPTAENPSSGAAGLAQALPPSKYPPGAWPYAGPESAKLQLQWMMGYIKDRYGSPAGAWAHEQSAGWYKEGGTIAKGIKHTLKGIAQGKHLPRFRSHLKKVNERLAGIGLSDHRVDAMASATTSIEKFAEYAQNASALTTETPEGEIIQGLFKGKNEGGWLNDQLQGLLGLRNQVIGAHGTIEKSQLPRIVKLLKSTKDRLRAVRKLIREAEDRKRALERKIQEIERAAAKSKQTLESEVKDLERAVDKEEGKQAPNKGVLAALRAEIKTRKNALGDNDKQSNNQVKGVRQEITKIDAEQAGRHRVETALKDKLIPTLEGQNKGMHETLANLFGQGGEIRGKNFVGLQQIQGLMDPRTGFAIPPAPEEVGGELFNVTSRLRTIKEEAERKNPKEAEKEETEIPELEKEANLDLLRKYLVSQAQYGVLRDFPTVGQIASVPYAGSFAGGGVLMAAEVGERGREIIAAPQGARVLPAREVSSAISQANSRPTLIIEELNVFEDGSVEVKTADGTFEADVRQVNRKQARAAAKPSPGIKRRRP